MADKKIIAVLGSTGSQGGGLVRAILADAAGGFAARAVTREHEQGQSEGALAAAGAEVVKARPRRRREPRRRRSPARTASTRSRISGSTSRARRKRRKPRTSPTAAKAAGVKHVVWSTLEDIRQFMKPDDKRMPMLQDKYRVPHFDAKAEAERAVRRPADDVPRHVVLLGQPVHVRPGPKKGDDGKLAWTFPMGTSKMAGIAAEDIGKSPTASSRPAMQHVGKTVGVVGEFI